MVARHDAVGGAAGALLGVEVVDAHSEQVVVVQVPVEHVSAKKWSDTGLNGAELYR